MTDRERLIELLHKAEDICDSTLDCDTCKYILSGSCKTVLIADYLLANDVIVPIRCKDCIHAIELDKHCDINRTAYKHCTLLRGDETKYVWHKYKKYYKDYSIVEPNDYCSYGIKRGEENAKEKE